MSLYVGNVDKWNLFFKGLGYQENEEKADLSVLVSSLKEWFRPMTEVADYCSSDFVNAIASYEIKRMGVFTDKSKVSLYSTSKADYSSMLECLVDNLANQDEPELLTEHFFIEPYKKFYNYKNANDDNNFIFINLSDVWSPSYLPLMPTAFIISNINDATHGIYFIPYSNVTEIWLYESSADFYRFRCFAEMIVVNTLAGYLGYTYLEEVTLDDLKKYNADLILNLDLLQQNDLPVE